MAIGIAETAQKKARRKIERIDPTVAEVTDQQLVTERSEIGGGQSYPPWRIERKMLHQAFNQVAVGVKHVDEPRPGPAASSCFSASCFAYVTTRFPFTF